jgi:hypothetical protein
MKKVLILFAFLAFALTTISEAQLRPTNSKYQITNTDAAGADTILITPAAGETVVKHTLTDSCHYKIKSTGRSMFGDRLVFNIINTAGGTKFKTIPASGLKSDAADSVLTITASEWAVQEFIFNGTNFVESNVIVK